jgi:hypothetical protein
MILIVSGRLRQQLVDVNVVFVIDSTVDPMRLAAPTRCSALTYQLAHPAGQVRVTGSQRDLTIVALGPLRAHSEKI